jgi:hypothetical protein
MPIWSTTCPSSKVSAVMRFFFLSFSISFSFYIFSICTACAEEKEEFMTARVKLTKKNAPISTIVQK